MFHVVVLFVVILLARSYLTSPSTTMQPAIYAHYNIFINSCINSTSCCSYITCTTELMQKLIFLYEYTLYDNHNHTNHVIIVT